MARHDPDDPFAQDSASSLRAERFERKRRRGTFWLIGGLAAAGVLGLLALFVGFVVFFALGIEEGALEPGDLDVLVTADDLVDLCDCFEVDPAREASQRTDYPDDTYELWYEYDPAEDEDAPYLLCEVTVDEDPADAVLGYSLKKVAIGLGLHFSGEEGARLVEREGVFDWGEQSSFALIETAGEATGFRFLARQGAKTFHLVVGGMPLEEPELLEDLLFGPLLELEGRR